MRQRRCALALAIAVGWAGQLQSAAAQQAPTGDRARARVLFDEGVELADQGQWDLAVQKFEEALSNYPAPAVEYNLASALYEMGRLGEASVRVEAVLADPTTPEGIREHAVDLDRQIRDRAGTLRIDVRGDRRPSDRVLLDGRPVATETLGRDTPANPGSHVIALSRGDETLVERDVTVVRGQTSTVELEVPSSDGTEAGSVFADWRLWAIVTGAVVVTAVVTALVVGDGGGGSSASPGTRAPLSVSF